MSGIGENYPTFEPLRKAFEAHAQELYGPEYMVQDFIMVGYVVTMDPDDERAEYVLTTSTHAEHIIEGLGGRLPMFASDHDHDDD